MNTPVSGCYCAVLTPMQADLKIDFDSLSSLTLELLNAGMSGLVAAGTTGEFQQLSSAERSDVVRCVVEAVGGRAPVWAGTSGRGRRELLEEAVEGVEAGASGLLCLPPFLGQPSASAAVEHLRVLQDELDVPFMVYYFPGLTGQTLPVTFFREIAQFPNCVGVKLSLDQSRFVHEVIEATAEVPSFSVMVGFSDLLLPTVPVGASGTISAIANVIPGVVKGLLDALDEGEAIAAIRLHRQVMDFTRLIAAQEAPIAALKFAAQELGAPLATAMSRTGAVRDADDLKSGVKSLMRLSNP